MIILIVKVGDKLVGGLLQLSHKQINQQLSNYLQKAPGITSSQIGQTLRFYYA